MALLGGSYVRPAPAQCSNPPPPGTVIWWRAHANVQRCYDSVLASGGVLRSLGVLGDSGHLLRCGGHTGHEPDSPVGVVHATDIDHGSTPVPPGALLFGDWLIQYCRSDADTTQIRFFNWRGDQFNYAGQRVADSGDWHCHLHFRPGSESVVRDFVALYLEYLDTFTEEDMTTLNDPTNQLTIPATTTRLPAGSTTGNAGLFISHGLRRADQDAIATAAKLDSIAAQVAAVTNTILGTAQAEALREEIRDAAEAAREAEAEAREVARDLAQDDLIRAGGTDPDDLAQRIVAALGPELASDLNEALIYAINNTRLSVEPPPAP